MWLLLLFTGHRPPITRLASAQVISLLIGSRGRHSTSHHCLGGGAQKKKSYLSGSAGSSLSLTGGAASLQGSFFRFVLAAAAAYGYFQLEDEAVSQYLSQNDIKKKAKMVPL